MALARASGSEDLKIPEPTNTASAPSCITSAASAGVAIPPAEKFGTGSLPCCATCWTSSRGAWRFLASCDQFFLAQDRQLLHLLDDGADVAHRFDDIAGSRFALSADHRRPFGDPPQRLAQIAGAADERNLVLVLIDVVFFIGRREYFALVDVIDAEGFENARFGEVSDAHLGHHRESTQRP